MKIRCLRTRRNWPGLLARVNASTARATAALDAALAACQGADERVRGRLLMSADAARGIQIAQP